MLCQPLLLAVTVANTAISFASASSLKARQQTEPSELVLFDIKANSNPPGYRACTRETYGHREL